MNEYMRILKKYMPESVLNTSQVPSFVIGARMLGDYEV